LNLENVYTLGTAIRVIISYSLSGIQNACEMTEHSYGSPHGIPHMLCYAYGSLDSEAPLSLDSHRCCSTCRLRVLFMKDVKHNRRKMENITN